MTDQYRRLTNEELRALYNQLAGRFSKANPTQRGIVEHVKAYYPKTACSAVLTVNSEYNDNTYDNSTGYLAVYDTNGVEIVPLPDTAKESRSKWRGFDLPSESTEPMEDITVFIGQTEIPDLYIKKP